MSTAILVLDANGLQGHLNYDFEHPLPSRTPVMLCGRLYALLWPVSWPSCTEIAFCISCTNSYLHCCPSSRCPLPGLPSCPFNLCNSYSEALDRHCISLCSRSHLGLPGSGVNSPKAENLSAKTVSFSNWFLLLFDVPKGYRDYRCKGHTRPNHIVKGKMLTQSWMTYQSLACSVTCRIEFRSMSEPPWVWGQKRWKKQPAQECRLASP